MADAGQRISPPSSLSSSSLPQSDLLPRPLKRPTPSDVDPSLPATVAAPPIMPSFHAKSSYSNTRQSIHTRATARNPGLAPQLPTMDPAPGDPDAVFIHPPFTDFPDAYRYKEGLTYSVLATHPDWFLDSTDYQQLNDVNPGGMKYPSQLEPPRGWCPAKKREVKDGWAEGEEPRLRCTFCRRTYAGVNAKSMWRRHVFEKHKIAMANRRENQERKGRNSNKNKESSRSSTATARGAAKVETQSVSISSSRSTYRLRPAAEQSPEWRTGIAAVQGDTDTDEDEDEDSSVELQPLSAAPSFATTPPRSPSASPSSTPPPCRMPSPSSTPPPRSIPSPPPGMFQYVKAESPYNPLLTPSFRHSPPRLPSEQPWRFPNPNHPLHSGADDLSLCMLAQAHSSPTIGSPALLDRIRKQSIFSPIHSTPRGATLSKATPRRLFSESMLPTPLNERLKSQTHRNSPLAINFTPVKREMIPSSVRSGAARSASSPAESPGKGIGLLGPIQLEDPFLYAHPPWVENDKLGGVITSDKDFYSLGVESPVLRAGRTDSSLDSSNESISPPRHTLYSLRNDSDDDVSLRSPSPYDPAPSYRFGKVAIGDGSPASIAYTRKRSRRGLYTYRVDEDSTSSLRKRRRIMSEPRE